MKWEKVIVHHSAGTDTEGPQIQAYRDYHVRQRRWRDLGYHFVCELIDDEFEVIAGRPLNMAGSHCKGENRTSIGFCFAGDFREAPPPQRQLAAGARWLAGLLDQLSIPSSEIYGHNKFRRTQCPGAEFDLPAFRSLVERYRAG